MKTIQGKVLFGVIPITDTHTITADGFNMYALDKKLFEVKYKDNGCFWLSEITEQQASELVYCPWSSNKPAKYVPAKEALESLLKANDCWTKEWIDKPIKPKLGTYCYGETAWENFDNSTEDYYNELEDYNNTPDDWLVVILNK